MMYMEPEKSDNGTRRNGISMFQEQISQMKKKFPSQTLSDVSEFTDTEGTRWVQTSTDDIFSIKELNDILESIERDERKEEVVLARIDFQKVNREYYDAAVELQRRLKQQSRLLKRVVTESREAIQKKNEKLRELIDYVRKLHAVISGLSQGKKLPGRIHVPAEVIKEEEPRKLKSEYVEVEEIAYDPDRSSGK